MEQIEQDFSDLKKVLYDVCYGYLSPVDVTRAQQILENGIDAHGFGEAPEWLEIVAGTLGDLMSVRELARESLGRELLGKD